MRAYKHFEIFGNWAALLLATDKDGNIDYGRLSDEIDVLIACRPNGIYSNGTAGEFYTLSEDGLISVRNCDGHTGQFLKIIYIYPLFQ